MVIELGHPLFCTVYYVSYVLAVLFAGLNNLLAAYDDKSAVAQCTFAFCEGPNGEVQLFVGKTLVSYISQL